MLLTGHVQHKRPLGRPEQTFQHGLMRSLKVRIRQILCHLGPDDLIGDRNAYDVANALRFTGNLSQPVNVDCIVNRGGEASLGLRLHADNLEVAELKTQAARDAGIRVGDRLVTVERRKTETVAQVRNALPPADENWEVKCRFERKHEDGADTWIDIAKDRNLWRILVYELFHDDKDY